MDQGSNKNHSPAYNFTPTVTKFCVMWEGLSLPHDTKFGNCRCKIVDSRSFHSWSLIHGLRWSGLIKVGPGVRRRICHDIGTLLTLLAVCAGNHRWIPLTKGQLCGTSLFTLYVDMNMLLNKQWTCWWFETPWHSCDVIIIPTYNNKSVFSVTTYAIIKGCSFVIY